MEQEYDTNEPCRCDVSVSSSSDAEDTRQDLTDSSNEIKNNSSTNEKLLMFEAKSKEVISVGCYLKVLYGRDLFYKNTRLRQAFALKQSLRKSSKTKKSRKQVLRQREYYVLSFIENGKTLLYSEQGYREVVNFKVCAYNIAHSRWLSVEIDGRNLFEAVNGDKNLLKIENRKKLISKLVKYFFIERNNPDKFENQLNSNRKGKRKDELIFSWKTRQQP